MPETNLRDGLGAMDRVGDEAPEGRPPGIHIELRLEGSMPAGVATGPSGAARGFTGWVGLMTAVDALATPEDTLTEDGSE